MTKVKSNIIFVVQINYKKLSNHTKLIVQLLNFFDNLCAVNRFYVRLAC